MSAKDYDTVRNDAVTKTKDFERFKKAESFFSGSGVSRKL